MDGITAIAQIHEHTLKKTRTQEMHRLTRLFLLAVIMAFCAPELYAQVDGELSSGSRRARRAYERAEEALRVHDYSEALDQLNTALRRDEGFIEAHLLMAEIHFSQGDYDRSIGPYFEAIAIDPGFYPSAKYYLGRALYNTGRYEEAASVLERFTIMKGPGERIKSLAGEYLERALFAVGAKNNPVPFDPRNPGPAINSEFAEYSPALTADEQTLIFTRKKPRGDGPATHQISFYEDFYISYFLDGEWTRAENLGPPLNTDGNEGAQTITADGRHLYFAACNRPDGLGRCDIYYSKREGDRWSTPVNPGRPLNSSAWDSQPSISADGNTIYFSSSRAGGYGQVDIWKATRNDDGTWNTPENLGPVINTGGDELSPFIHHDNKTLYFASDGHPGMGGLDIFLSRMDDAGIWSEPENLGYPINTHGDEFAMIVGASGRNAWFASDIDGGYGDSDLYTFELYPEARPQPHTFMKGVVADAGSGEPLMASFELIDLESGVKLTQASSDPVEGTFLVAIPSDKDLALNVSKDGYLFFSENFSYAGGRTPGDPWIRNIDLQPIAEGQPVVLRNVFFETDSYSLRESSFAELNRLAGFLKDNPALSVEISGHTDSTGSYEYNLELSRERARSVRDYLTGESISPERISYRGYADTRPVDTNETEEGRANNRRTEFSITGSGNDR